jgi:peptide subunit release factor 1 (eRF1)
MVEGGVGGVGTHPGEQNTTVNNTQCQQEIAVKNNPKEKGNRNNGQTKIKRIVKNKLLSKLPSKISKITRGSSQTSLCMG